MKILTFKELTFEQQNRFTEIVAATKTQDTEKVLKSLNIQENDLPVLCTMLRELMDNFELFDTLSEQATDDEYEEYFEKLANLLHSAFQHLSGSLKTLQYLLAFTQSQKHNDIPSDYGYHQLFANGGVEAISLLKQAIADMSSEENPYGIYFCFDAWESIIQEKPEYHSDYIEFLFNILRKYEWHNDEYNAFILSYALNFSPKLSLDYIDLIREVFAEERVLLGICGDLEDAEIKLGLRTERATPKPNYNELRYLGSSFDDMLNPEPSLMNNLLSQYHQEYAVKEKPQPVYQKAEIRTEPKIGRNDPCPCGSGKKYKKCCGA
ncbi:YecA family protein [Alysiella crassa]|uniref:Predicted metal-binding protein related to the C-terminal domain of SecA n=1 Tax=Alysiella crassa TaxID=153491 RepID=A0A376BTY8_9NEIS|nr:Predicted metal-binding protein related to the C-terminal domain of SecA [Alysiella crassa]